MKKTNIVKNNRDFTKIITNNQMVKNSDLVIYYDINTEEKYRFGISVGKKIGNAVIRNLYKRRIRTIVDNHKNLYSKGVDYIIIVRKNCLIREFEQIEDSFIQLMNKINGRLKKER